MVPHRGDRPSHDPLGLRARSVVRGDSTGAAGRAPHQKQGTEPGSEKKSCRNRGDPGGGTTWWLVGGRPAPVNRRESAAGVQGRAPEGPLESQSVSQERKKERKKCGDRDLC